MNASAAFTLGCTLLCVPGLARAENWPNWRGPAYDGISQEKGLPAEWGPAKNLAWKLPLPGVGGSTPVIWGDRIFLTSEDGSDLVLLCMSTDGKELWKRKLASTTGRKYRRDEGNDASPSPSTDGKFVYTFVGVGDLACFDFEGKEIWKFNAQERYGRFRIQWGMHITPLLYGDRLYLPLIHSGAAWVIALDKATGKEVWKVERKSDGTGECEQSYASPCVWQNGKDAYLIVHGNDYATAHSLKDGSEIWRVGDLNSKERYRRDFRFVASPVAVPELIVVPSCKNGPIVGVKPEANGFVAVGNSFEQWRHARDTPDVPSPLVHEGLVYLCKENGALICMDAKTGKEFYNHRNHEDRYRASPVYADGKIYLTSRDGTITVVKAGPKYDLLSVNKMGEVTTSSPAIANGRIYIRSWKNLYAIETAKGS